jgi:hypothetical protein
VENKIQLPYEIKYNRYYNLLPLPFIIGLMTVFVYFVFIKQEDADGQKVPAVFFAVFGFVMLVGLFLIYQFAKQFFKPRALFYMDEEGMEYNEGGIGTGKLQWKEIYEIKEIEIKSTKGRRQNTETVLGVILKDPEKYRSNKNHFLGKLMKVSDDMYNTSILISPGTFGKNYVAARNKMQEMVAMSNRRGPGYESNPELGDYSLVTPYQ